LTHWFAAERGAPPHLLVESSLKIGFVLREPLLHFLLIGMLLFLLFGKVAPRSDAGTRIAVARTAIAALAG